MSSFSPLWFTKPCLFALKRLAIGAFASSRVRFVRTHLDCVQRTVVTLRAVIAALLYRALDRLVFLASIGFHTGTSFS